MTRARATRQRRVAVIDANCPCQKRAYATKDDANRAARIARRRAHESIHEYRCPHGHWHIGHGGRRAA